jgi:cytochrome b561
MTPAGYSRLQIALHWLIAALLVGSFITHEGMKAAWKVAREGGTEVNTGATLHVVLGISILVLTLVRLALRQFRGVPAAPDGGSRPLDWVATATHWALLALLLLLPASGGAAWFLGIREAGDTHEVLFTIGWILVALHTAAALFHQYVLKDGLLLRMRRPG